MKIALERFNLIQFNRQFAEAMSKVNSDLLPVPYNPNDKPKIHDGTIAAGEKLIADGSIEKLRNIDERIRAADMEDSGFAQVAEFEGLPWCVFRGISDHGDPHKKSNWQFVAALAAGCAEVTFLKYTWEPPTGQMRVNANSAD
jgi:nucleoside phosphorylase